MSEALSGLQDRLIKATLHAEGAVELRLVHGQLDQVTACCSSPKKEMGEVTQGIKSSTILTRACFAEWIGLVRQTLLMGSTVMGDL